MSRYSLDQLFPLAPDPVAGCMRSGLDGSGLGSAVESPPGANRATTSFMLARSEADRAPSDRCGERPFYPGE
jgi:hypothetical protein